MEKRLFTAIALSVLVVWLWSSIAPKPPMQLTPLESSQSIENGTEPAVSQYSESLPSPSTISPETFEESTEITEKIEVLNSEKLTVEISNIGGSLSKVTLNEYGASLPLVGITSISGYENLPFNLDPAYGDGIRYVYETEDFKIIKTYEIQDGDYIVESGIEFYNNTEMSKLIDVSIISYVIEMSSLDKKDENRDATDARDKSLNEYVININNEIDRKAGAFKFSPKEKKEKFGQVLWSGFRNRYFCALIKPQYDTSGYTIDPLSNQQLEVSVNTGEVMVLPKSSVRFDSIIYIGPEKTDILKEYQLGFEKVKKYYRFALLDGIAKIIDGMMHLIYKVVPNWGVCILLISVIIYFSMYPLTLRGMQSMKKMQSLQPVIAKLKAKHKDNPQKMNKEMMEIYKEHKVNPLGGCLPMLLQMPVFIGLYQVLWRSVSFKGAHFLWIKDLSQPDRLFMLPFTIPFLGNEFNLLPLIMVVVMFFQQKLSAKNMVVTDPAQLAHQKMMTTIMPAFRDLEPR